MELIKDLESIADSVNKLVEVTNKNPDKVDPHMVEFYLQSLTRKQNDLLAEVSNKRFIDIQNIKKEEGYDLLFEVDSDSRRVFEETQELKTAIEVFNNYLSNSINLIKANYNQEDRFVIGYTYALRRTLDAFMMLFKKFISNSGMPMMG